MREMFLTAVKRTIKVVHYHTSVTAFFIRHTGNQISNFFDRWQVVAFQISVGIKILIIFVTGVPVRQQDCFARGKVLFMVNNIAAC